MARKPNLKMMALQVENWNRKHPVGTTVVVTKDLGEQVEAVTTSLAYVMGGHSAVIHVSGISGCYRLDRVQALRI
ncbi:MAG: hypothetical protein LDL39_06045 [Magnetospirillum sp.]|nr:hypothetical protein [Magnetospirillum sp.]